MTPAWFPSKLSAALLLGGLACLLRPVAAGAAEEIIVAADGTGMYKSVQDAINAVPQNTTPEEPCVIRVKAGVYHELLYVQREKRYVQLIGDDPEKTVITYDLYAALPGLDGRDMGTFRTATAVIDADDFTAENITFENTAGLRTGGGGQAMAIRVDGDRVVFRRCHFLGWEDTVFLNRGRHYFAACYIAGQIDFIFGGAEAYFENCRLHCLGTGYLTAASTPKEQRFGFVFSHCHITGANPETKTYLGRPWRSYGSVIFLDTEMSTVVRPEGWFNWGLPEREKTSRFAEFGSTGPGANMATRVSWTRPLTEAQARSVTVAKVLAGPDAWDPHAQAVTVSPVAPTAPSEPAAATATTPPAPPIQK